MTSVVTALGTFTVMEDDYAIINELPTSTPGWACTNLDQLLIPAPKRGTDNTILPNADGRVANPFWEDQLDIALEFQIDPRRDWDDTPDTQAPAYRSLMLMRDNWGPIPNNPTSTVDLELNAQGDVWSGTAQLADLRWTGFVVALRIIIPAGGLTLEVASA